MGDTTTGSEIALVIDQALLSDVLGMLVMLKFEAMALDRIRIPLAVQYCPVTS